MQSHGGVMKLSVLLLVIFLSSCSNLTKKDCSTLNWHKQGINDGKLGMRKSLFVQHAAKCLERPNREEYLKGRKKGLKTFCSEPGLYERGYSGGIYLGECGSLNSRLKDAYDLGRETYREAEEIKEFQFRISELEEKLKFVVASTEYDERSVIMDDISILRSQIAEDFERIKALRMKALSRKYIVKSK